MRFFFSVSSIDCEVSFIILERISYVLSSLAIMVNNSIVFYANVISSLSKHSNKAYCQRSIHYLFTLRISIIAVMPKYLMLLLFDEKNLYKDSWQH